MMNTMFIVITCKGRLHHIKQSIKPLMDRPVLKVVVVDYDCPDMVGDWLQNEYKDLIGSRLFIERVYNAPIFYRSHARNLGGIRAAAEGATHILFNDADVILNDNIWDKLILHDNKFIIVGRKNGIEVPYVTGLILVPTQAFISSGGYNMDMIGWGAEDIEFRLKLYMVAGLDFEVLPYDVATHITHSHFLRIRFHNSLNMRHTDTINKDKTRKLVDTWHVQYKRDPVKTEPLWYKHTSSPPVEYTSFMQRISNL